VEKSCPKIWAPSVILKQTAGRKQSQIDTLSGHPQDSKTIEADFGEFVYL
jgi:hypothetical protein